METSAPTCSVGSLCPTEGEIRDRAPILLEKGDRRQETGDRRQETGDRRQETGDRRQGTGNRGQGSGKTEKGDETGDRRQETEDKEWEERLANLKILRFGKRECG